MHSQTLISTLVWIIVLCSSRVVSGKMSEQQKMELADKLNMLVQHSGWRLMADVKILKRQRKEILDPISEILEAISLNRMPVDESNVLKKYEEIWTVLRCKYGEIIFDYKDLINHLIRVCHDDRTRSDSFRKYYVCFDFLLIKLHSMSLKFKCMLDALEFIYSLVPQTKTKYKGTGVMVATQELTMFALTIGPTTAAKLSEHSDIVDVIDHEINAIGEYISEVYKKNIHWFTHDNCKVSRIRKWTLYSLTDNFTIAKYNETIPQYTTMLEYLVGEIDSYVNETFDKWFRDLGFGYDVEGKIKIGTN